MKSPKEKLEEIIDDSFKIFSKYKLKKRVEGCSHCITDEEAELYYKKNLRSLTNEDLSLIYGNIVITWGGEFELKYFLPRIFENVSFFEDDLYTDLEIIFSRLRIANWLSWPEKEVNLVRKFLLYFWDYKLSFFLSSEDRITPIEEILCAIANAENQISDYLDDWLNQKEINYRLNFLQFIDENHIQYQYNIKLDNGFWKDCFNQKEEVINWFTFEKIKNIVYSLEIDNLNEYQKKLFKRVENLIKYGS